MLEMSDGERMLKNSMNFINYLKKLYICTVQLAQYY